MDHTRIEPRTSTAPHGSIRRLSPAGLATVAAGAFLLFFIVGSGRAQAPTRNAEEFSSVGDGRSNPRRASVGMVLALALICDGKDAPQVCRTITALPQAR
jgi:hypothetical protein